MINEITTRVRTDFPSFFATYTNSNIEINSNTTNSAAVQSMISQAGGTSQTIVNYTNFGTTSNSTGGASASDGGGFTTYQDATMLSYSYQLGTVGSGSSFSSPQTALLNSTAPTGVTITYNTTSSVLTTESFPYVSGSGANATLTSSTRTLYAVSNESSGALFNELVTSSYTTTEIGFNTYTTSFSTYIDIGTVVRAEAQDWLWSVTAFDGSPALLKDLADSFTAQTFWPVAQTYTIPTATYGDPSQLSNIITIAANSSVLDYEYFVATDTSFQTMTSGDLLSRDTVTRSFNLWTTTSDSLLLGADSYTLSALSTYSVPAIVTVYDAVTVTQLYQVGYYDSSTSTLKNYSTRLATSSNVSVMLNNEPASSTAGHGSTAAFGGTAEATYLGYRGLFIGAWGTDSAAGTIAVPAYQAFIAPSDLRSSAHPLSHIVGNLSLGSVQVPYPFEALRSVARNVYTPLPAATSTTGTDGASWQFSWSRDTLQYSSITTSVSGTHTLTQSTTSSGVFETVSARDTFYAAGGQVLGGYRDITSLPETVLFPARAVIGTEIATDAASTTYRTLWAGSNVSTLSAVAYVESNIPAYQVFSSIDGGVFSSIVNWQRNP